MVPGMESIALLLSCAGGGSVSLDDSATLDTADTSDSATDTQDTQDSADDTGLEEEPEMRPDYVYFTQYWGWNEGPAPFVNSDGSETPPLLLVSYYDARFFDAQDEDYVCLEYFTLEEVGATDAWGTYRFELHHQFWTDDPCVFGAGPMEDKTIEVGVDTLSEEMRANMKDAVGEADWPSWEPHRPVRGGLGHPARAGREHGLGTWRQLPD